jgi:hypothetical protein
MNSGAGGTLQRDICQAVIGRDVVVKPSLDVIAGCRASIEDGSHQSRVCSCPSKIYDKYIWRLCFRSLQPKSLRYVFSIMPIRPYLDKHRFDAETVRLTAIVALRQTSGMADPPRDEVARIITERDPDLLCEAILEGARRSRTRLTLRNISFGTRLRAARVSRQPRGTSELPWSRRPSNCALQREVETPPGGF